MQAKTEESLQQLAQVQVISRAEIPERNCNNNVGSIREFQQQKLLKNFLPSPDKLSFFWLSLNSGEELFTNPQPLAEALIVYRGQAKLLTTGSRIITAGDAVLIPPQCRYNITEVTAPGLFALSLAFANQKITIDKISSTAQFDGFALNYDGLVAHNKSLLEQILANPYFTLLREDKLENPKARQMFLNSIQVFSDFFQHMLFIRQATCHDPAFNQLFLAHLKEELGHDKLLSARKIKRTSHDAILHATSMWFCNQMFILDNLEKTALVHLVLEVSGTYYHNMAKEKLGIDVESDYYEIHTQVDDIHAKIGENLLHGQPEQVYRRLHNVIYKGWHMLDAMTRRVAELVTATMLIK